MIVKLLIRIGIAIFLGGLIGLEREKAKQTAGLRTHILISLGAALVMCMGEFLFHVYSGRSNIDPTRLGAQVISGVGILCAGAIMKEGSTVKGLTTATGLWCTACIALAVGGGVIIPAVAVTVMVVIVLRLLRYLEKRHQTEKVVADIDLVIEDQESIGNIVAWFYEQQWVVERLHFQQLADKKTAIHVRVHTTNQQNNLNKLQELLQKEGVMVLEILLN